MICPERARLFTESMRTRQSDPIVLRRARAFAHVLEHMSLYVGDDELIVGNQASSPKAAPVYPEYSCAWLAEEFAGKPYRFDERPGDKFYFTEDTKREILSILDFWKDSSLYETLRGLLPDEINKAWDAGVIDDTWVSSAGLGNLLVDFGLVLTHGLEGIIDRASRRIMELDLTQPDTVQQKWFLEAVVIVNKAVIAYSERMADLCESKAAAEPREERKRELLEMARNCRAVPRRPAENFYQGLQSVWVVLMALHLESNGHAISLGRFDQYLYPLLKKSLADGSLNKARAQELLDVFFIKVNELNKLRSWPDTSFFLGYQMFVNLTVGGQTVDGKDAVNELSYMCVTACEDVRLFTPSVSIKVSEHTPDDFLLAALRATQVHKGGMPAFYNDTLGMAILRNMGIAENDLCNWAPVGCIESAIQGKWDYAAKGPWMSVAKVLEITLNGGRDPRTGVQFFKQEKDLSTYTSMDELALDYQNALHFFMRLQVMTEHINNDLHVRLNQNAFRSSLVEDCIGRGKSLIEGGAVYTAEGGPTCGSITAADSLAAIEELVFKDKRVTGRRLLEVLKADFKDDGKSPNAQELLNLMRSAPKFGNDENAVDKWAFFVTDYIGSTYQREFKSPRYGKGPVPGCYAMSSSPVTGNIAFGAMIGALPNGKRSGAPVNNGMSPSNGAEISGPTAAIRSMNKLPSIWFQKGAIFNVRLTPDSMATPEGIKRVMSLIKVFFKNGGQHIQFNVVGSETLRAAQRKPEEYQDLMVRVSGYSAFFTPLHPDVQNDLIQRMEYDVK
jgi:formate C-acetyltransferase